MTDTFKVMFRIGDWVNYVGTHDDAIGQVIEIRDMRPWSDIPHVMVQYPGHVFGCHVNAFTFVSRETP